jgi:hypothetical protein
VFAMPSRVDTNRTGDEHNQGLSGWNIFSGWNSLANFLSNV